MSAKTLTASSMSTASASNRTPKTLEMRSRLVTDMTHEPEVVSDGSSSLLDEALAQSTTQLAWDNDVRFQISRHLVRLRRYRGMSQARLAQKAGTSQSAIARIESGDENATATTIARLIDALGGRFIVSIQPQEFPVFRTEPWWRPVPNQTAWDVAFIAIDQGGEKERALVGLQRTTPRGGAVFSIVGT